MNTLWFIVPAHGRLGLAAVCLRQLKRTCDRMRDLGVDASAVVIACDENLEVARDLGFGTVDRDNLFMGRRLNDGYQLAGREHVDYVCPVGSDDWVDPEWMASLLPASDEVRCSRLSSVVNEDATRLAALRIPYPGGDGVRVYPTGMFRRLGYRPVDEDRKRALDTNTFERLNRTLPQPPKLVYHDTHAAQIVDWKSAGNLNSYRSCLQFRDGPETDPWETLARVYPPDATGEMRALHGMVAA